MAAAAVGFNASVCPMEAPACTLISNVMCEGRYGGLLLGILDCGEYPEVLSGVTAVFIMWCGLHMLLFFRCDSYALALIAASFFVNGLSASISHLLLEGSIHDAWDAPGSFNTDEVTAIVDRMSLLFTAWFCCAFMLDEAFEKLTRDLCGAAQSRANARWRRVFVWTSCLTVAWVLLGMDVQCHDQTRLVYGVAVPILVVVAAASTIQLATWGACGRADKSATSSMGRWAVRRFWLGCGLCVTGIVSDRLTEQYCDASDFAKLFPGHALWHISTSLGLVNVVLYGAYLLQDDLNATMVRTMDRCCCECCPPWCGCWTSLRTCYFAVLPGFRFVSNACEPPEQPASPRGASCTCCGGSNRSRIAEAPMSASTTPTARAQIQPAAARPDSQLAVAA